MTKHAGKTWQKINRKSRYFFRQAWMFFRKALNKFSETILYIYPLIFGGLIAWDRYVRSTSAFLDRIINVIFSQGKHFPNAGIDWVITGLWLSMLGVLVIQVLTRKREKDDLPESLTLQLAREYFDFTKEKFKELEKLENEFVGSEDERLLAIASTLSALNLNTRTIASSFFKIDVRYIGINYMLFVRNNDSTQPGVEDFIQKSGLYVRDTYKTKLKGILLLLPQFNFPVNENLKNNALTIPIYLMSEKVYNSKKLQRENNIALPGAPTAFFNKNSVIKNPKNIENYRDINSLTQEEILNYFEGNAPNTRSLMSFRLPKPDGNPPAVTQVIDEENEALNSIGVLNIESTKSSSFGASDRTFEAFYTFIYPTLKLTAKHLEYYRNSVEGNLNKK